MSDREFEAWANRTTATGDPLRAAWQAARKAALLEAAEVCQTYSAWSEPWGQTNNMSAADKAATECADKLRAMAEGKGE